MLGDSPTDAQIEEFMASHGFELELDEFKQSETKRLREFAAEQPDRDTYVAAAFNRFRESITLAQVYGLDDPKGVFIDIVFAVIGIGAAYQLVMGKSREDALRLAAAEPAQASDGGVA